jgi:hypothetical protein
MAQIEKQAKGMLTRGIEPTARNIRSLAATIRLK